MRLLGHEQVAAPQRVVLPETGEWTGVGAGFRVHGSVLSERLGGRLHAVHPQLVGSAVHVARLAKPALERGAAVSAAMPTSPTASGRTACRFCTRR